MNDKPFKKNNWTQEETIVLNEYNTSEITVQELSEKISRSANAIAQKLLRLGFVKTLEEVRGFKDIIPKPEHVSDFQKNRVRKFKNKNTKIDLETHLNEIKALLQKLINASTVIKN